MTPQERAADFFDGFDTLDPDMRDAIVGLMEAGDTTINFTIKVQDPDAMVAWARENIAPGAINEIVCYEVEDHFLAQIEMTDANQATLLKTFWAK